MSKIADGHLVGFSDMSDLEESPEDREEPRGLESHSDNRDPDAPWPFQTEVYSRRSQQLATLLTNPRRYRTK